jgi:chromosome segregation ATPase
MTNEEDLATLDAVVKRRLTESTLEYATLKKKVDSFQHDLKTRKASLEAGTIIASESQNEVATCEKVHNDVFNNLEKLRRTIEHYEVNKDLLETLDSETRIMIAKDHGRRLGEMKKELETAATHLQEARRKVEAEWEEVKQRIKEDEAKLVSKEAGLELAHTEHDRWRCMEHFATMKADDLKKVMAGLEKEGLGLPKSHEKQSQPDSGIGSIGGCKTDSKASGSN